MSQALKLEQLIQTKSKTPIKVPTPEIDHGTHVYVLDPTPDQSDLAQVQWTNYRKSHGIENVGFSKFLVAWALCDENNVRLIDSGTEEDRVSPGFIESMNQIGGDTGIDNRAFRRIFDKAMQSFGLSKQDLEELEGNSETTQAEGGNGSKPKQSASRAKNGGRNSKASES